MFITCMLKKILSYSGSVKNSLPTSHKGETTRMGLWNKSLEDMLYGYDAELWDVYPKPIVQAFFAVSYEDDSLSTVEDGPPYPWPRDR